MNCDGTQVAAVLPSDQDSSWELSAAAVGLSRPLGPIRAGQPPGAWSRGARRRWLGARASEFAKKQRLPASPSIARHDPNVSRANLPRPRSADSPLNQAKTSAESCSCPSLSTAYGLLFLATRILHSLESARPAITGPHFSDLRMRCLRSFRDHCRLVSLSPFED